MLQQFLRSIFAGIVLLLSFAGSYYGQSSDPAYPTPITSSELSGTIKARDIGDSRLTTYYYAFDGTQGDIFINIVSKNLSGDVDVFTETGLRPLTKIVLYSDVETSETGRLIYLRKPERLILRVQGRPPGDDPASFQIKFGGSFVALAPTKDEGAPVIERPANDSGIEVNSVGTIVAVKPKPRPTPKATPAEETVAVDQPVKEVPKKEQPVRTPVNKKPVVVVDDFPGVSDETGAASVPKPGRKPVPKRPARQREVTAAAKAKPVGPPKESAPDPLANVRLVVTLKNGDVVDKGLTELIRFSFDKGVLTLIGKDGTILRYPMTDVAEVKVQ